MTFREFETELLNFGYEISEMEIIDNPIEQILPICNMKLQLRIDTKVTMDITVKGTTYQVIFDKILEKVKEITK